MLPHSYSHFLLMLDVGVTESCDEDEGELGEDEVEELVERPGTTKGTWFAVLQLIFLPFLMRCGF